MKTKPNALYGLAGIIFKALIALLIISPFYIAVIYSVKSKP
jgi:hypothetical protein